MKKTNIVLCGGLLCLSLTGCGGSREPLSDEQIKDNMSKNDFDYTCTTANKSSFCSFSNKATKDIIAYSEGIDYVYIGGDAILDIKADKILEGDGDKTELRQKYSDILKKTDVKTDELSTFLKKELDAYVKEQAEAKEKEESEEHKIGDKVVVSAEGTDYFSITVNSVKTTTDRNSFDNSNPADVVIINYSYENLNMDDDLYISSVSFNVLDEGNNVVTTYPVSKDVHPQQCPKGAKSDGEEAYGLKVKSGTITLKLEEYLPNGEKATRVFKLKVD